MLDIFEEEIKLYGKRNLSKIENKHSKWYTLIISQSIPFVLLESKKRGKYSCHTKNRSKISIAFETISGNSISMDLKIVRNSQTRVQDPTIMNVVV